MLPNVNGLPIGSEWRERSKAHGFEFESERKCVALSEPGNVRKI